MSFVKYVAFIAKEGQREELLNLILKIRDEVLANEPGTKLFQVVVDPENGEIITWQHYENEQALQDRHNGKTHALWLENKERLVGSFVSRKLPFA